jgi:hypothetical protein
VQLAAVPVPTTVVGFDVSTSCPWLGSGKVLQEPSGLPAGGNAPESPASLETAPEDDPGPLEDPPLPPDDPELPPELEPPSEAESPDDVPPFELPQAAARTIPKAANPNMEKRMGPPWGKPRA